MNYEVITLEENQAAGISARTNNTSPDMGMVIGGLWNRFYQDGIYTAIPHKKSEKALGIYTDYDGDEKDDYSVVVACEVGQTDRLPEGIEIRTIPAGKYAKFVVKGHVHQAVAEFWSQLWQMNLPRNFKCDFEEYQDSNMENAEVHIYIGLKEDGI